MGDEPDYILKKKTAKSKHQIGRQSKKVTGMLNPRKKKDD